MFRYSATLADEVDEAALQRALEQAVELFPGFNVRLRSGMFWHYLEQSDEPPAVMRESLPICYGLHVHAKARFCAQAGTATASTWRSRTWFRTGAER